LQLACGARVHDMNVAGEPVSFFVAENRAL
jgi:hypothetical protein